MQGAPDPEQHFYCQSPSGSCRRAAPRCSHRRQLSKEWVLVRQLTSMISST